jgi:hypothetical protein
MTGTKAIITELLEEVDNTDPNLLPPPYKIEKGEKIVGTIRDEYTKRIFSLSSWYRREGQRLEVDLKSIGEDPLTNPEFTKLRQKHETLVETFWLALRFELNYWTTSVGIRKDWTVVDTTDSEDNKPASVLKRLLGGE